MNRDDNTTQTRRRRFLEGLLVGIFSGPYWILLLCSQLTSGISGVGSAFALLVSTISTMFEAILQIFSVLNKLTAFLLKAISWKFRLLSFLFNSRFCTQRFARSSSLGYLLTKIASAINGISWILEKINWIAEALKVVVTSALLVISSLLQIFAGAFQLASLALKFTSLLFWLLSLPSRGLVWFLHWRSPVKPAIAVGAASGPPPPAAVPAIEAVGHPAVVQPLIAPPIDALVEAAIIDPVEAVHVVPPAVPLRRNPVRTCRSLKQIPVVEAARRKPSRNAKKNPKKNSPRKARRNRQLVDTQVEVPPLGAGIAPLVGDVAPNVLLAAADAIGDPKGNVGAPNQPPPSPTVAVDRSDMALVLMVSVVVLYVFLQSPLLRILLRLCA